MNTILLSDEQHDRWNQFVSQQPFFGLLQSWEWGVFKQKLGWKPLRIAVENQGVILAGAQLLIRRFPLFLGSVAYIPHGPLGQWREAEIFSLLMAEIHRLSKAHRALLLKIEPTCHVCQGVEEQLVKAGFCPNPVSIQPRATILVNLSPPFEQIYAQMHSNVRQKHRNSIRNGVSICQGGRQDLPDFYHLLESTASRAGFPVRPLHYYQDQWDTLDPRGEACLMLATYQCQLIAGAILFRFGKLAALFHMATDSNYLKLNSNISLVINCIQWAKNQGCQILDLWGIPNEIAEYISAGQTIPATDRSDGLWGVYKFKRQFSDHVLGLVSAFDYHYHPLGSLIVNHIFNDITELEQLSSWMDRRFRRRE